MGEPRYCLCAPPYHRKNCPFRPKENTMNDTPDPHTPQLDHRSPVCPVDGPRPAEAGLADHPGYSGWGSVQTLDGEWMPCLRCGDCGRVLLVGTSDTIKLPVHVAHSPVVPYTIPPVVTVDFASAALVPGTDEAALYAALSIRMTAEQSERFAKGGRFLLTLVPVD